jgi:hypothetical protein
MYKHLLRYDKHKAKGYVYFGDWLVPSNLTPLQWAIDNPKSLIETQKTRSASLVRDVVLKFFKKGSLNIPFGLFRFDLTQNSCFTAIQLSSFSNSALETEEVLILKGTFFSVAGIEKDDDNITVISLVNVPADENVLLTATS